MTERDALERIAAEFCEAGHPLEPGQIHYVVTEYKRLTTPKRLPQLPVCPDCSGSAMVNGCECLWCAGTGVA